MRIRSLIASSVLKGKVGNQMHFPKRGWEEGLQGKGYFLLVIKFHLPLHRKNSDLKIHFDSKMSYLTIEKKANIFKEFGGSEKNTGSIEGQIALLTERINSISEHLKANKKDFSTHRGLMQMVGKRKRLLSYLSKTNLAGYRELIEKLGLRK